MIFDLSTDSGRQAAIDARNEIAFEKYNMFDNERECLISLGFTIPDDNLEVIPLDDPRVYSRMA